ncbi:MAG: ribN 1 [Alphaproteobacteria bacterium]|jgi:drug/metabolite transporter (DMT)-like permease|nr:ribN 1 [Alphaproteobacteria bacterium]
MPPLSAWRARWQALPATLRGILWAALAGLLSVALNVLMRDVTLELHPFIVLFWRYVFGTLALLPLVMTGGAGILRVHKPSSHVLRSLVHTAGLGLWFYALPMIPIAETTALGFTTPLFITLGAIFVLHEQVGLRRIMAVVIGFVGMLIILRPGLAEISQGSILMLISAPLFAGSNLLAKLVARDDSITAIVTWQSVLVTFCCVPAAILVWQTPSFSQLLWLLLGGALGTASHLALSQSYKVADITAVQPIGFLTLVWATLLGYAIFGDKPDLWTWIGAAVIFAANTYISHRELVRRGRSDLSGDTPPPAH